MKRLSGNAQRRARRQIARTRAVLKAQRATAAAHGPSVSPLAPKDGFPALPSVAGVRLAAASAGVKYRGRDDVMLAVLDPGTVIAGVTTRSATRAAPVLDCEAKLQAPADLTRGAAIIVNSGNANAFTGSNGAKAVRAVTQAVADATGLPEGRVFSSSTGVIGEPLPHERITKVLSGLAQDLQADGFETAAKAIMTTDTFPKATSRRLSLGGEPVNIVGIAKGSGMIAPDMATMLVYIFTDARLAQADAQALLSAKTDTSFNCITVDSDTSTSDTLLFAATGRSGPELTPGSANHAAFAEALDSLMTELCQLVVRDGEGATKLLEVQVTGATDDRDARVAGLAIANSPLVKTAIAGEDPNWGRVVMAVGKSGAQADRDRLSIWFGDHVVAEQGWVSEQYSEEIGAAYMKQDTLVLRVDLGIGSGQATVWTCDFTHGYISINADYRS